MIYAAIVLYNKNCADSVTIQSLQKWSTQKTIRVVIFDNSISDFGNEKFCTEHNYKYLTYHENKGLSFAYNRIIENIQADSDDYVLILDDDTELTEEFLREIVFCEKKDINLPVVRSIQDGHIFSPSIKKNRIRSIVIQSVNELEGNQITAINSGMVIKASVFESIRYNESLFLDCVDHDFMDQVNERGYEIKILQSLIFQNLSRQNIKNNESTKARMIIYGKDFKKYCYAKKRYIYFLISFFQSSIEYYKKTGSFSYLRIYFKTLFGE